MPNIQTYKNFSPPFDIRKVLNGPLRAAGVFFDMFGRQQRQFNATLNGSWKGNHGQLDEEFIFYDGEKQTRHWQILMQDDAYFTATAGDVAGTARGQQCGNAVNMRYDLIIPIGKNKLCIHMDDWMYLLNDKTIINRTVMRKFGIKLGELTLVIEKC